MCAHWSSALTAARHAYVMRPPADDLVHALKYEGWPELAAMMGDALARLVNRDSVLGGRRALVVPVPTTAERLRSRGYNQAELLAKRLAEVRDLPMREALRRPEARPSQTSLTPAERLENVRGAFESTGAGDVVRGAHVLLVDDVLTTGATASEAAVQLDLMGAQSVTVLTYGRALATGPEEPR